MYYVTAYSEYPIYERAEGGYYYTGVQIESSRKYQTWRKAKQSLRKLYKAYVADGSANEPGWFETASRQHFGWCGKYIGEGWFIKLERTQGKDVCGWRPYE